MTHGPRAAGIAATALSLLIASRAWADPSIGLARDITRDVVSHPDPATALWISQSDCLANDMLHFPLAIRDGLGLQVEAWVGQGSNDCTQTAARTGTTPICTKVYNALAVSTLQESDVRTQDIAAVENGLYGDGLGKGTPDHCSPVTHTTQGDSITIYFMLMSGGSIVPFSTLVWSTVIDLVAPVPPTGLLPASRNGALDVRWTPGVDPDVAGYDVFCDSAATSSGCSSGVLMAGQPTTSDFVAKYICAVVRGRDAHAVTMALPNGQRTAVSVAAVDAVGNVGRLSEVACETPRADAPGASPRPAGCGSKGICSVSRAPGGRDELACLALLVACAGLRRRSRTRCDVATGGGRVTFGTG